MRRSLSRRAGGNWPLVLIGLAVGFGLGLSRLLGPAWGLAGGWIMMISIVAFVAVVMDKRAARRSARRTAEHTLLLLVALGGTLGAGLAMLLVRHKTSKAAFLRPFWLIVAFQVIGLILAGALYDRVRALLG